MQPRRTESRHAPGLVLRAGRHYDELLDANGVTYNVYADPKGKDRPWVLDPLPFLLREEEWCEIAVGLP